MKKSPLAALVALLFFANTVSSSFAAVLKDVPTSYWAYPEINSMVESGLMTTNSKNEFRPNETIRRTDFVAILLRVCDFKSTPISRDPIFKDVKEDTRNLEEILTAEQLRIIYGYPDRTFKPEIPTKRAESASAIAHVINTNYNDESVLSGYKDAAQIPAWALNSYIQNAANGLIVNYPDSRMLEPNKYLTRGQAASLLVKVYNFVVSRKNMNELTSSTRNIALAPVDDGKIKEVFVQNETLSLYPNAPRNIVEIYNTKIVIGAGNVLIGSFTKDFDGRKANVGDEVVLVAKESVSTNEGRLLYSAGTRFSGKVQRVKKSIWLEKQDKALLVLGKAITPEGQVHNMAGVPLTISNNKLAYTHGKDKKEKLFVNFGSEKEELSKAKFLVKFANKVSPRIKYSAKADDEIYFLLTGDLIMYIIDPKNIRKEVL